jgi:prevent-host-death family protein
MSVNAVAPTTISPFSANPGHLPMHKPNVALNLAVDLEGGVVPISKAASALAFLLKRARERQQPIIVTQKGYPTGILLDIETYTALRERALVRQRSDTSATPERPEEPPEPMTAAHEPASVADPASGSRQERASRRTSRSRS